MAEKKGAAAQVAPCYPFKSLIGHDPLLRRMASVHAAGRLPAALLLEGREGIGKRLIAAAIASLPFCSYGVACGSCEGCRATVFGNNADLFWVDEPGPMIKLESIRQLQEHLSIKSGAGQHVQPPGPASVLATRRTRRIAIIVDADRMNQHAANRLLKTLEEPSEDGMIMMTTSRMHGMLPTVLSRLVRWHVAPPGESDAMRIVQSALAQWGEAPCDDGQLRTVLRECGYAPGAALALLTRTGEQRLGEVDKLLASMIGEADVSTILDLAQELGRGRKLGVDLLVQRLEVVLHAHYRTVLGLESRRGQPDAACPAAALSARRRMLNHAHRQAVRNKVALNAQLFLEAVGMAGK